MKPNLLGGQNNKRLKLSKGIFVKSSGIKSARVWYAVQILFYFARYTDWRGIDIRWQREGV
jgi:hypothetical protein